MELGLTHGNNKSQDDVLDTETLLAGAVHTTKLRCVDVHAYIHMCVWVLFVDVYSICHIVRVKNVLCAFIIYTYACAYCFKRDL